MKPVSGGSTTTTHGKSADHAKSTKSTTHGKSADHAKSTDTTTHGKSADHAKSTKTSGHGKSAEHAQGGTSKQKPKDLATAQGYANIGEMIRALSESVQEKDRGQLIHTTLQGSDSTQTAPSSLSVQA
jgi:hypothetical protein